ncbi:MAG: phosphatase PAP2 family protein [Acetobacteraceae bacterium]|nr:phosphatase PAP2 family protein [Acetobacteraceae bacterium]
MILLLPLAALFAVLLWQVQSGGLLVALDGTVNAGLKAIRNRTSLAAGAWISQIGTGAAGMIVCLVASGALWSGGRLRWVVPIWVAFIGAQTTTWSLKFLTDRQRPNFLDGITAASPSFPSAHATVSMAVYGIVALAIADGAVQGRGVVFTLAAALIVLISFSRLLLSLHYLTDVLAGATVGLFWIIVAWQIARAWP